MKTPSSGCAVIQGLAVRMLIGIIQNPTFVSRGGSDQMLKPCFPDANRGCGSQLGQRPRPFTVSNLRDPDAYAVHSVGPKGRLPKWASDRDAFFSPAIGVVSLGSTDTTAEYGPTS